MMESDRTTERIATLEEKTNSHSIRIERIENNNKLLHEMKVLLELQTEMNKEQNKQMKSFEETLSNVNSNLTRLNTTSDQLKIDLGSIGDRVNEIEQINEKGKISVNELTVKIFIALAMIIPTAITAWVLMKLGL